MDFGKVNSGVFNTSLNDSLLWIICWTEVFFSVIWASRKKSNDTDQQMYISRFIINAIYLVHASDYILQHNCSYDLFQPQCIRLYLLLWPSEFFKITNFRLNDSLSFAFSGRAPLRCQPYTPQTRLLHCFVGKWTCGLRYSGLWTTSGCIGNTSKSRCWLVEI